MEYIVETKRSEISGWRGVTDPSFFFEERCYYIFCPLCGTRLYATGDYAEIAADGSFRIEDGVPVCAWDLSTEEQIQEEVQQALQWHYEEECPFYTEHLDTC